MSTRSMQALYGVIALGVMACSPTPPPPGGTSDAGVLFDEVQLTRVDSSPVRMSRQSSRTLHVLATNLASEPVPDVPIEWTFIPAPSTQAQLEGEPHTDVTGTASATVTMGDTLERLTVRASLPNGGASVEWEVGLPDHALRGVPALPVLSVIDAPDNLNVVGDVGVQQVVELRVSAVGLTDSGEVPLAGQKVAFHVFRGVSGTNMVEAVDATHLEKVTQGSGKTAALLKVGDTTGGVTVLATYGDALPVTFELNIVP